MKLSEFPPINELPVPTWLSTDLQKPIRQSNQATAANRACLEKIDALQAQLEKDALTPGNISGKKLRLAADALLIASFDAASDFMALRATHARLLTQAQAAAVRLGGETGARIVKARADGMVKLAEVGLARPRMSVNELASVTDLVRLQHEQGSAYPMSYEVNQQSAADNAKAEAVFKAIAQRLTGC